MKKNVLEQQTEKRISDTKSALQLLYDHIPKGQQKQLVKIPEIKEMFDRYKVIY